MSHPNQREFIKFVKREFPEFFENRKILEIGSFFINESVRKFFSNCNYTGVDLESGKGVDLTIPGQLVDLPSKSFDVTISCECFEHNPFWIETFINMIRMTKSEGLVIMTCACYGRPEHGTVKATAGAAPFVINKGWNYYYNLSASDFQEKINFNNWFSHHQFFYNHFSKDIYFIGVIKSEKANNNFSKEINNKFKNIEKEYQNWKNFIYQKMCILLGRQLIQNLKLYWLINPQHHINDKWKRILKNQ